MTDAPRADAVATALAALAARADPQRAVAEPGAGSGTPGIGALGVEALGVGAGAIDDLTRLWRAEAPDLAARLALARDLWASGIAEARLAAAKLLTQARIPDDGPAWALIAAWAQDCDGRAIADAVAAAGARRLSANPARLDEVEGWLAAPSPWTRRAPLAFALPWAKGRHLSAEDAARRERALGWAETCAEDPAQPVQQGLGAWLRRLSKHDPDRVRAFARDHGARLSPAALREATALLR